MLSEPVTSPKRDFGKLLAGMTSAIVVFLFRYFGEFEMGFASALIIMNAFSPLFDGVCEEFLYVYRHKDSLVKSFMAKKEAEKAKAEEVTEVSLVEDQAETSSEEKIKEEAAK